MIFIKKFKIEYAFRNKFMLSISWVEWNMLKVIKRIFVKFDKCIYGKDNHCYFGLNLGIITLFGILFSPSQGSFGFSFMGVNFHLDILNKDKIMCHNIIETIK